MFGLVRSAICQPQTTFIQFIPFCCRVEKNWKLVKKLLRLHLMVLKEVVEVRGYDFNEWNFYNNKQTFLIPYRAVAACVVFWILHTIHSYVFPLGWFLSTAAFRILSFLGVLNQKSQTNLVFQGNYENCKEEMFLVTRITANSLSCFQHSAN